jgi:hypothetical protein
MVIISASIGWREEVDCSSADEEEEEEEEEEEMTNWRVDGDSGDTVVLFNITIDDDGDEDEEDCVVWKE